MILARQSEQLFLKPRFCGHDCLLSSPLGSFCAVLSAHRAIRGQARKIEPAQRVMLDTPQTTQGGTAQRRRPAEGGAQRTGPP